MSVKGCRRLQLIALILFLVSVLFCLAAIPLQGTLKRLFSAAPDVLAVRSIPWGSLLPCLGNTILALVFFLLLRGRLTPGKTKAVVIVFAILIVLTEFCNSLLGTLVTGLISRNGVAAIASYTSLQRAVSWVATALGLPARVLMLLAMGGVFGKDLSAPPADSGPYGAEAYRARDWQG